MPNAAVLRRRKIHVDLPVELHQKLKIKAALSGLSMQAFVTRLVAEAVGQVRLPGSTGKARRERRG